MQKAFKTVLTELAVEKRETDALRKRQEIVKQEFKALFQSQGILTKSRAAEMTLYE